MCVLSSRTMQRMNKPFFIFKRHWPLDFMIIHINKQKLVAEFMKNKCKIKFSKHQNSFDLKLQIFLMLDLLKRQLINP